MDKEKIKGQANIDIFNLRKAQEQGVITEFGKGKLEALEGIVDFIDSLQEETVSEEQVKEDTMTIRKEWFEHCKKSWYNEGYIDGEYNRDRQFEKERLKHCDALTEEQAQIESDFVVDFIKKNNRTPTFIDAIEYGKKLKLKDEK